jgi:predicted O-linked N-acetylglucosamine transferase (SPINDLY family)
MPERLAQIDALLRSGDVPAAWTGVRRALVMDPGERAIHNLIGVLADAGYDLFTATIAFGRALASDPLDVMVLGNLTATLSRFGMVEPSLRAGRRTLALAPGDVAAHNNTAQVLKGAGHLAPALEAYRRALAIRPNASIHSNLLFAMSYDDATASDALFAEYRRWERNHARPFYPSTVQHDNDRNPDRPIVVGYLSQDFCEHPLGRILTSLIDHHDATAVRVNGYSIGIRSDELTERCRSRSATWRSLAGLSDDDAARRIREDRVDILVIVGGHTANNRLPIAARRPAPIQVALDDVSTSGIVAMDYWISDPILHPPDGYATSERFCESLLRLPCFFLQPPYELAPPVTEPPCLTRGRFTFGSFSNPAKLTPTTISAWSRALEAVPGSMLMLKYVDWYGERAVQQRITDLFVRQGIDRERIIFAVGDHERDAQLALWNEVDIALDPYPFGGWTSTFESLWMGVPPIVLAGERFAGRIGLAVLERLDLGKLVARRPEDFASIAGSLAADRPGLGELRTQLRSRLRLSPLCDGRLQAGYFETAYRDVWRRWCAAQAPAQASR